MPTGTYLFTGDGWEQVADGSYEVVVEAYSHDGQPDLSVNIGMIYDGEGSSTASVAAEPRPRPSLAWPQVHDFVPPHYCGLLEEQCFPLQAWAVLPSFAELPPAAGPATEGFWALFQVSPSPTVSGSRSLNLYLPAVRVVRRTSAETPECVSVASVHLPTSWAQAYLASEQGGGLAAKTGAEIEDCVQLPPGYSVMNSTAPLTEVPDSATTRLPACSTIFTSTGYATLTSGPNAPPLRAELASAQWTERSNVEAFLGGILLGVGASLLTSVLYDWISRLVRS